MGNILNEIYLKDSEFSNHTSLEFIYTVIDDMLIDKKYVECDNLLAKIDIHKLSITSLSGILVVTLPLKHELPSRKSLFTKIKSSDLSDNMDNILRGLE